MGKCNHLRTRHSVRGQCPEDLSSLDDIPRVSRLLVVGGEGIPQLLQLGGPCLDGRLDWHFEERLVWIEVGSALCVFCGTLGSERGSDLGHPVHIVSVVRLEALQATGDADCSSDESAKSRGKEGEVSLKYGRGGMLRRFGLCPDPRIHRRLFCRSTQFSVRAHKMTRALRGRRVMKATGVGESRVGLHRTLCSAQSRSLVKKHYMYALSTMCAHRYRRVQQRTSCGQLLVL